MDTENNEKSTAPKTGKKDKIINISIIAVMAVIIGVTVFFWVNDQGGEPKVEDAVYCNTMDAGEKAEPREYESQYIEPEEAVESLEATIGVVPILPGTVPHGIIYGNAWFYTPKDANGNLQEENVTAYVESIDQNLAQNGEYGVKIRTYVSKSLEMAIDNVYSAYNGAPETTQGEWSTINNHRFKLFKLAYGDIASDNYFALFTLGKHAWRIEFYGIKLDDVSSLLTTLFYAVN